MAALRFEPDEARQPDRSQGDYLGFHVAPEATATAADHLDKAADLLAELRSMLMKQGDITAPGADPVSVAAGRACQAVVQEQLVAIDSGRVASRNLAESLRRYTDSH